MVSSDYRYISREALRGSWIISIILTLIATLLGAGGLPNGRSTVEHTNYYYSNGYSIFDGYFFSGLVNTFIGVVSFVVVCIAVVRFIIGASMGLGVKLYNMKLVHRVEQAPFSTLVERFPIFGKALGLRLLMLLFVGLWSLLFVIPGIIAMYRYAMAPYLMAQYPDIGVREAMDRSKQLMAGHKAELFFLHLSFIGWWILGVLCFGIGVFVVNPYFNAAEAAFYLDLTGQLAINRTY